ncbi:MAG: NRDE family protein [Bacteroidota bacterium]|nr:NRDE family protein [Bacteroidota bacterium]
MCTVTYIPTPNGFYFTSSRDEKASRETIPPAIYNKGIFELVYPKDVLAGGTWIASSLKGKTACLLNGAFGNHTKQENYSKSRGLILLESFNFSNTNEFADRVVLNNVEPFTLLTLDYSSGKLNCFYEFRWDGQKKYIKKLNASTSHIWSSATLYNPSIQQKRNLLFNQWLEKHSDFEDSMILDFHNKKHGLGKSEDIIMKGEGDLMTLSISQVHFSSGESVFNYFDIINGKSHILKLTKEEIIHV